MKVRYSFIGLLFLTAITAGCSDGKPKDFDYGEVENGKYVNSYFGMEMSVPENWIVMSQENFDEMAELGAELMVGDNKKMKSSLKASEITTANLLMVSEYEVGAAELRHVK